MKRRAMTDRAKADKAQSIVSVAYDLYKEQPFEAIKMSDIAKVAGVSKGTLFLYYKTKESLFMEIIFQEYEKRFARFEDMLLPLETITLESFKILFLHEMESILDQDSVFVRLVAIKSTVLEKNVDYDTMVKVSIGLFTLLGKIVQLLTNRLPVLTAESYFELLQAQNAIIIGYANAASLPVAMHQVLGDHKLDGYRVNFKKHALLAMEYYLDGLIKHSRRNER
ncbi:TetR family transcriptional regulator [Paenibacillus agricola]|uniref:TetR/AcrR family transcriptional regulator n=1 Tax=Paenibacillus agricola TaxID=2716264 RepID=A0ABX0J1H1_9BACL|nr:TetR family transcriptional regulator [Paenibacillus agricola]NHN29305.1 TetR/AcrR family transcriptional regulator [Paenibacillus agricola]